MYFVIPFKAYIGRRGLRSGEGRELFPASSKRSRLDVIGRGLTRPASYSKPPGKRSQAGSASAGFEGGHARHSKLRLEVLRRGRKVHKPFQSAGKKKSGCKCEGGQAIPHPREEEIGLEVLRKSFQAPGRRTVDKPFQRPGRRNRAGSASARFEIGQAIPNPWARGKKKSAGSASAGVWSASTGFEGGQAIPNPREEEIGMAWLVHLQTPPRQFQPNFFFQGFRFAVPGKLMLRERKTKRQSNLIEVISIYSPVPRLIHKPLIRKPGSH